MGVIVAMHAPDGFLDPSVAVVTAILSLAILGDCLSKCSGELQDHQIPLAGVSAAFIFSAQMFNFPVAAGTTGHLLGGALAAVLLGPYLGSLVVAIVVVVQAFLFADGGISALGYNLLNMAIVPAFGGWAMFVLARKVLPANRSGVVVAAGLASAASVVAASVAFSIEWLFGASAPVPFDTVFSAMVGVHALIGIGEGVVSAMVVAGVLASRPDLVAGASDLELSQLENPAPIGLRAFVLGGVLLAAVLGAVVSQFAFDDPDGLERVAIDNGFMDSAANHWFGGSLFADYATRGIGNERLSLAVAGLAGAALALVVAYGMFAAARRPRLQRGSV